MRHNQFSQIKSTKPGRNRFAGLKLSALFFLAFCATALSAQQSIHTAGNNASGSGGHVSYSVGQAVYQTHTGTTGTVAEGVQQAYEISVVGLNALADGIALTASAFPNPVSGLLKLHIDMDIHERNLVFQLINLEGKQVESRLISSETTEIHMGELKAGVYFLKLLDTDDKVYQNFKIIKR